LSDFHSSKEWIALSKLHKVIERARGRWKCTDCSYKGDDMTSDHVLCVKYYGMFKLWLCNLALRCGPCNSKKGTKFYVSPRSLLLLGVYYSVKIITRSLCLAVVLFVGRILYYDLTAGGFDTTFFFQALTDVHTLYVWIVELMGQIFGAQGT